METHLRSIVKAISWRAGGTVVTCLIAWALTGSIELATRIGILDTLIKLGAFYLHERLWSRLDFGRERPPEYHI